MARLPRANGLLATVGMILRSVARSIGFTLGVVGAALQGASAAEPTLELPKYTVSNEVLLPPRESWRYTAFPGFEVLSQASEGNTIKFLRDFQMLQQVIAVVWPDLNQGPGQTPTVLILFDDPQAQSLQLPGISLMGDQAELAISEVPSEQRRLVTSRHYSDQESACIFVNLGSRLSGALDPYRQFYREYVRFLIERRSPGTAPWLQEGIARVVASVDFTDKWFTFGQVGRERMDSGDGDFNRLLGRAPNSVVVASFPSLEAMLRGGPVGRLGESALANAFVHMCIYGRGRQYQQGFLKYVSRANGNFVSEEFFVECFGMSMRKMQDELQGYVSFTDHVSIAYEAKKGHEIKPTGDPVMRAATQAEIGRVKGDAFRLARRMDAARVALLAPYLRHEQDANLLAALGIFEVEAGRNDYALRFLEAAVAGQTTRTRAAVELARLREGRPTAPVRVPPPARGTPEGYVRMAPLTPAMKQQIEYQQQIMGLFKSRSPATPAEIAKVDQAVAEYPDAANLVFLAALVYGKAGLPQKGIDLLDKTERKRKPADIARFLQLRKNLVWKRDHPGVNPGIKTDPEKVSETPAVDPEGR
jgi:hypothetical protein